jgi:hypothetical protein
MEYAIDGWNNFCRVFKLPKQYPGGFCFGGGLPVTFMMVDWFNPVPGILRPVISKEEWTKKFGAIEFKIVSDIEIKTQLVSFLKEKVYVAPGETYLAVCNFGLAFQFNVNGLI